MGRKEFACWFGMMAVLAVSQLLGFADEDRKSPQAATRYPENLELEGLENVFRVSERIYSGSGPIGSDSFRSLKGLGVTGIISVDGQVPDVAAAQAIGLRYFHLPLGYDAIRAGEAHQLIRIVIANEGPLYVHCHHGKHRGPAAVAMICQSVHGWSKEKAQDWLKLAGASAEYKGLYQSVLEFQLPDQDLLAASSVEIPESVVPSDIVDRMVSMDDRWDRLQRFRDSLAGPGLPKDSDLDPAVDALLLVEDIRELARDETTQKQPAPFHRFLQSMEKNAMRLYELLRDENVSVVKDSSLRTSVVWRQVAEACSECHKRFRN